MHPWLAALRPAHWLKNSFTLAPLLFGRRFLEPQEVGLALATAGVFCLASSAGYLFNDVRDCPGDRQDPQRARRPVAAGQLSPAQALAGAGLLAALGLGFGFCLGPAVGGVVGLYLLLTFTYSAGFKQVPGLDVLLLASGFVLRLLAGAFAIGVPPSRWLLLCGFLLALALSLGKRWQPSPRRPSYPRPLLAKLTAAALLAAAFSYIGYTLDPASGQPLLPLTIPPVLLGLARFWALLPRAPVPDPTLLLLRDRPLQGILTLWLLQMLWLFWP